MEIADQIIVINDGRVEQAGTPDELYDRPVNQFVMGFLGPVTQLGTDLVRPHDIRVSTTAEPGSVDATVDRLTSLGFETRIVAKPAADAPPVTIQLTRNQIHEMNLAVGTKVHLSTYSTPDRVSMPAIPQAVVPAADAVA
jgi:sulfate transport system ATP-binding protein